MSNEVSGGGAAVEEVGTVAGAGGGAGAFALGRSLIVFLNPTVF